MTFEEFKLYLINSSKKVLFKGYPFTVADIFKSDTALKKKVVNIPPSDIIWAKVVKNASNTIANIIIPILDFYKEKYKGHIVEISVNSVYRCKELNKLVGGAVDDNGEPTSQHSTGKKYEGGEAIDFTILVDSKAIPQKEVFNDVISGRIKHKGTKKPIKDIIDQFIYEGTWNHASYSQKQRRRNFLVYKNGQYKVTTKEI